MQLLTVSHKNIFVWWLFVFLSASTTFKGQRFCSLAQKEIETGCRLLLCSVVFYSAQLISAVWMIVDPAYVRNVSLITASSRAPFCGLFRFKTILLFFWISAQGVSDELSIKWLSDRRQSPRSKWAATSEMDLVLIVTPFPGLPCSFFFQSRYWTCFVKSSNSFNFLLKGSLTHNICFVLYS